MKPSAKVWNVIMATVLTFSLCALRPESKARAQSNEPGDLFQPGSRASVTDEYGNVIEEGNRRFNYMLGTDGRYWKVILDQDNHILGREELPSSPYDASKLKASISNYQPVSAEFTAAAAGGALALPEWRYGFFGTGIGDQNISVFDIDNDSEVEMVIPASTDYTSSVDNYWYVVENTGPDTYAQTWISMEYDVPIARIEVADINADNISEIFVGLVDGDFQVYDGSSLKQEASFSTGEYLLFFRLADADSDGVIEIVATTENDLFVYSATTHALEWSGTGFGGQSLAIGNVDSDLAMEIVTSNGMTDGFVINGKTHAVEWHYTGTEGFGSRLELGDIDSDGKAEIVGAKAWYKISIFDADIKSLGWEITTDIDIDGLLVADVEGDGVPEVLYGDAQWGSVFCYNGITHAKKWSITNPDSGVSDLAIGDVNADGTTEVMWASGSRSTGDDHLYVADTVSHLVEWQNIHIDGPLSAVDVGDVDDDGDQEIVMVSYSSNGDYDDGIIHIFNAVTHVLEWQSTDLPGIYVWCGVRSVIIADVDDDGQTEFVIAADHTYDGLFQVYNGTTHEFERQSPLTFGASFSALAIGDVDSDGHTEIVVGQEIQHSGATGQYLIVYDGATAIEEWRSSALTGGPSYDIELADVDDDSQIEIVLSMVYSIYVFDGVTHETEWTDEIRAYALEVADIDEDDTQEILVGEINGVIEAYQGNNYLLDGSFDVGSGIITGLLEEDLNQDGTPEWLISNEHRLAIALKATNTIKWQSAELGLNHTGYGNQLNVADIDEDNHLEIVVGSSISLYQFDLLKADSVFEIFLPFVQRMRPGIGGHVAFHGEDKANVPLDLQFYNGSTWAVIGSTFTNKQGEYSFSSPPSLQPGQKYSVTYTNTDLMYNGHLSAWKTRDLTSYTASDSINIGNFDICDPYIISPQDGIGGTLPMQFRWEVRELSPDDNYQFALSDPLTDAIFTSPLLGYVDNYTLDSLPVGFSNNRLYDWTIYINSPDGGWGVFFYHRSIVFVEVGP